MVPLRNLNQTCSSRSVANAIPAQIACRLLGNTKKPCQLDNLCKATEKVGVWSFYAAIASVVSLAFILIFWVLRITRASKLLHIVSRVLMPPFKWLSYSYAALYNFYKNLPF